VVTIIAGTPEVQVARCGEPLTLFRPDTPETMRPETSSEDMDDFRLTAPTSGSQESFLDQVDWAPVARNFSGDALSISDFSTSALTLALAADARRDYRYQLRDDAPMTLVTEKMPPVPDDFEAQVADQIDFTAVLADRDRVRTRIVQRTMDLFEQGEVVDEGKWASLSVEAIAEKASQLVFQFDVDHYSFPRLLEERFRNALTNQGIELPKDAEFLLQQLDIDDNVLWWHRNPSQQETSVGLYGWSLGKGFFPDFVVGINDRKVGNGIALVEVKGQHLQHYERAKASARHKEYGLAFMVGYDKEKKDFVMFREEAGQLYENGRFETARLRWDN